MTIDRFQDSWAMKAATTVAQLLSGVAIIGAFAAWLFGGFNGIIIVQHDMINFGKQISDLGSKVADLSNKIDSLPRRQDMQVMDYHLAALDARADGIEGRLRQVELDCTADHSKLENIFAASALPLPEHHR
jgi:hypothetical protein